MRYYALREVFGQWVGKFILKSIIALYSNLINPKGVHYIPFHATSNSFSVIIEGLRKESCAQRAYMIEKLSKLPCNDMGFFKALMRSLKPACQRFDELGDEGIDVSVRNSLFYWPQSRDTCT